MRNTICSALLVAVACLLAGSGAGAQQSSASASTPSIGGDVAFFYAAERAQPVPGQGNFWFQGGSADIGVTLWRGWGVAASFETGTASNIATGIDEKKITVVAGPRYTRTLWHPKSNESRLQIFAQGMTGAAHGFGSIFPANGGTTDRATAIAVQAGGGFNYITSKGLGLRLLDAEYVRSLLPNAASDVQNDLRLGAGINFHFRR
jgi:hypothetical protein